MGPSPETLDVNYIKCHLKNYKVVSVREQRSKAFIETNNIYHPVELVLDPTMLLTKKDYECIIEKQPLISGKYIFYYTPGGIRHEFLSEASKIGHQLGIPVVCDNYYAPKDLESYDNVIPYGAVGPLQFLNLIKNATYVCGASFHLMVFSLIFNKQFCCMNGDRDSRMNNLMKLANAEDHIWSIIDNSQNSISDRIVDYVSRFRDMRENSMSFLNNNLRASMQK